MWKAAVNFEIELQNDKVAEQIIVWQGAENVQFYSCKNINCFADICSLHSSPSH